MNNFYILCAKLSSDPSNSKFLWISVTIESAWCDFVCVCVWERGFIIALKGQIIYSDYRTCLGKICNMVDESPHLFPNTQSNIKENWNYFVWKQWCGRWTKGCALACMYQWVSANFLFCATYVAIQCVKHEHSHLSKVINWHCRKLQPPKNLSTHNEASLIWAAAAGGQVWYFCSL